MPLVPQLVYTVLPCLTSMIVAPVTPLVAPLEMYEAPVNVTAPKLAKGTNALPLSKSYRTVSRREPITRLSGFYAPQRSTQH